MNFDKESYLNSENSEENNITNDRRTTSRISTNISKGSLPEAEDESQKNKLTCGNISLDCSSQHQSLNEVALQYLESNLAVMPFHWNKTPALSTWKEYKSSLPTRADVQSWFQTWKERIGFACGTASRNLEVIDFDEKYNFTGVPAFDQWKKLVDEMAKGLVDRLPLESTVSGGFHVYYRCATIDRNLKLARRPTTDEEKLKSKETSEHEEKFKTLIETRGIGGCIVSAPSKGYVLLSGSLTSIPTITTDERAVLLEAARALNTYVDEKDVVSGPRQSKVKSDNKRPGDRYNETSDVTSLLQKHAWQLVAEEKGVQYWRRPGKSFGISATFNYVPGCFYVFSSNAGPFESERAYGKFAIYTMLEHAGDFKKAAAALGGQTTPGKSKKNLVMRIKEFIDGKYSVRYNTISQRLEIKGPESAVYEIIDDRKENSLFIQLLESGIQTSSTMLYSVLNSEFATEYDAFKEYCMDLEEWDHKDHIGELLSTLKLKNQVDLTLLDRFFRMWLVNLVASMVDRSYVNQVSLILVGPQGVGKTRWLNRLVPDELEQYRYMGNINPGVKDSLILLTSSLLINLDELETLNKYEIGLLKSVMTMDKVTVRRPYDKYPLDAPRRASFVGSINRTNFLRDETGNRRFLIFEVDSIDLKKKVDMSSVYSQAYHLFKSGFRFILEKEEIRRINDRNKKYLDQTTEDELLIEKYEPVELDSFRQAIDPKKRDFAWKTATEIADEFAVEKKYQLTGNSAARFGTALRKAGFQSKNPHGRTLYAVHLRIDDDRNDNSDIDPDLPF